jgi:hypothetical protein
VVTFFVESRPLGPGITVHAQGTRKFHTLWILASRSAIEPSPTVGLPGHQSDGRPGMTRRYPTT